jgi:Bacterial regulatory protein, Fis family
MDEKPNPPEDIIPRIHAAMEECDGDIARAARILHITGPALRSKLQCNSALKLRWLSTKVEPAPAPAEIHRPELPAGEPDDILKEDARALLKEDALVRSGIESIGVTGKELELAVNLQKFHRAQFRNVLNLLGGGLAKQFIEIMQEVRHITELLSNVAESPVRSETSVDYEGILRKDRATLIGLMNGMYDRALQATLVAAKIAALRGGKSPDGRPARSPGFGQMKRAEPDEQAL